MVVAMGSNHVAAVSRQVELFEADDPVFPSGIAVLRGRVAPDHASRLLDDIMGVFEAAPPYRLRMKTGAYVINRMTNCGAWGWHSDAKGYRYVDRHPEQDTAWPAIPPRIAGMARDAAHLCGVEGFQPDACLVNLYAADGKMNLHQDRDEADFSWPIVSFSFGNEAVFELGGEKRRDPAQSFRLSHGDVLVMHGPGRMRFHAVKRIVPGTAPMTHPAIPENGRLNLTLRRAT